MANTRYGSVIQLLLGGGGLLAVSRSGAANTEGREGQRNTRFTVGGMRSGTPGLELRFGAPFQLLDLMDRPLTELPGGLTSRAWMLIDPSDLDSTDRVPRKAKVVIAPASLPSLRRQLPRGIRRPLRGKTRPLVWVLTELEAPSKPAPVVPDPVEPEPTEPEPAEPAPTDPPPPDPTPVPGTPTTSTPSSGGGGGDDDVPFIGEIRMFAGNFAPRGWALCDGQLLAVSSNTSLFAILGTTYGGDGRVTFGLPDLRGRFAMHPGNGPGLSARQLGEAGGDERVTLNESQLPSHSHQVAQHAHPEPVSDVFEAAPGTGDESEALPTTASTQVSTSNTGGGQPVQTMPPFRTVNYIICTQGSFPSRQ